MTKKDSFLVNISANSSYRKYDISSQQPANIKEKLCLAYLAFWDCKVGYGQGERIVLTWNYGMYGHPLIEGPFYLDFYLFLYTGVLTLSHLPQSLRLSER